MGEPRALPPPSQVHFTVSADAHAQVVIDGRALAPVSLASAEAAPGRHQIVLMADGKTILARWVTVSDGAAINLDAAGAPPCSRADLERARTSAAAVSATGVQCKDWLALRVTSDPDAIQLTRCEAERCPPLRSWRTPSATRVDLHPPRTKPEGGGFRWPAWATWTIAGVGVVALSSVALAVALKSPSTETHFVSGGVKIDGFHF